MLGFEGGGLGETLVHYIKGTKVSVYVGGTEVRTEFIPGYAHTYIYSLEKNVEDNGTPQVSFEFRLWFRDNYNQLSPEYASLEVQAATPPNLAGLAPMTFGGRECEITWTGIIGTFPALKDYKIEILTTGDSLLRTEYAADPRFVYTWDMNQADSGGPRRSFKARVKARSCYDLLSTVWITVTCSNASPSMSGYTPSVTALYNGLRIDWSSYSPTDIDLDRYKIYCHTDNPPTTVRAIVDAQTRFVYITGLDADTTYYVQIEPYDAFGNGGTKSSVASGSPDEIPSVNIPEELRGNLTMSDADSNSEATLAALYDGVKDSGGVVYTASGWTKWIQYRFPVEYITDRIVLWTSVAIDCYIAYSDDGSTWSYLKAEADHTLDADGKLVSASNESDAQTNYWTTGSGKSVAVFPNQVKGKYFRLFVGTTCTLRELIFFREIVAEMVVCDELSAIAASLGLVSAGVLQSSNWGSAQGCFFDLDNEIVKMGGSSYPALHWDGSSLIISGYSADQIAASGFENFKEVFEDPSNDFDTRWPNLVGGGEVTITTGGLAGGKIAQIGDNSGDDQWRGIFYKSTPYDENKLYRVRCRIRRTAGTGVCYIGVAGRNSDDTEWVNTTGVNGHWGQHYVAAGNASPADWTVYTGYFKGRAASGSNSPHPDPSDPGVLHNNVRYFRPFILVNHSQVAGTYEIDEYSIDIIPESADSIAESATKKWASEAGADVTGDHQGDIDLANVVGDLDDIPNGADYGRILVTDISAGHILLSACSGDLDDIADGTYGKVATTSISAGKIVLTGGAGVTGTLSVGYSEAKCTDPDADQTSANSQNLGWLIGTTGTLTISADGKIVINTADALEIQAAGNIKVLAGGDIVMMGDNSNPAFLIFDRTGAYADIKMGTKASLGGFVIYSTVDGQPTFYIGVDEEGGLGRFWSYGTYSAHDTIIKNIYGTNEYGYLELSYDSGTDTHTINLKVKNADLSTVNEYGLEIFASATLAKAILDCKLEMNADIVVDSHKARDIGADGLAFDDIWADDFHNVADFYHLDKYSDLAALVGIRKSRRTDPRTRLPLIDDRTIPKWMLARSKDGKRIIYDPEGKPYLSQKMMFSVLMGAIKELDTKIEGLKS